MLVSRGDENAPWSISFARIHDLSHEGCKGIWNIELWSWSEYLRLLSPVCLTLLCASVFTWLGLTFAVSDALGLGWGLRMCILTQVMLIWELTLLLNHCTSFCFSFYKWENWGHLYTCINQTPSLLKALLGFHFAFRRKSQNCIIQNTQSARSLPIPPHHGPHRDLLDFIVVIQGPCSYLSIKSN